jgi:vesicular inhibitory amino acid transporter
MDWAGAWTYSDLGEACFGRFGRFIVTIILFGELFSCGCAYIVLVGDTLASIAETSFLAGTWWGTVVGLKTLSFLLVLLPTTLLGNLRVLSVGSLIGIFASVALGVIMVVDAVMKPDAPGSIWEPAETDMFPSSLRFWLLIPMNLGLVMYNYSGGAVIPNLVSQVTIKIRSSHVI